MFARTVTVAALLLLLGGCATEQARVQETEQMLAAAGFGVKPANTPQQQAQLASLPPHRVLAQPRRVGNADTVGYVYADPDVCHCMYVGDASAFQQFQQLAFQQRLADQYMAAAEMQQQAAFDWSMWGPDFWPPPPVVVVHEHPWHH